MRDLFGMDLRGKNGNGKGNRMKEHWGDIQGEDTVFMFGCG